MSRVSPQGGPRARWEPQGSCTGRSSLLARPRNEEPRTGHAKRRRWHRQPEARLNQAARPSQHSVGAGSTGWVAPKPWGGASWVITMSLPQPRDCSCVPGKGFSGKPVNRRQEACSVHTLSVAIIMAQGARPVCLVDEEWFTRATPRACCPTRRGSQHLQAKGYCLEFWPYCYMQLAEARPEQRGRRSYCKGRRSSCKGGGAGAATASSQGPRRAGHTQDSHPLAAALFSPCFGGCLWATIAGSAKACWAAGDRKTAAGSS